MLRHIRDLNVESARDFKFNQSNNRENDQKMADNAYLLEFTCFILVFRSDYHMAFVDETLTEKRKHILTRYE